MFLGGKTGTKLADYFRRLRKMEISGHAGHACFFMVLSIFPMLVLLLGLLRYTPLEAADLMELIQGLLPEALRGYAWNLISSAYANSSRLVVSVSALTALWSAGKGIYGLMRGLDAVYGLMEARRWLKTRLICAGYTFLLILVLVLTLALQVFGESLLTFLRVPDGFLWANLRFFLLIGVQTLLFCTMFMKLPQKENGFWESLPGALLGAVGWMVASSLFSVYVRQASRFASIFGSVYAVALGMLWLYICICILLYGGVLNRLLAGQEKT